MNLNKLSFATLFTMLSIALNAQEIEIKQVFVKEGKVHLIYDLHDQEPNRTYQLRLYSSKDNYISPLNKVKGDAGLEVPSGTKKEII